MDKDYLVWQQIWTSSTLFWMSVKKKVSSYSDLLNCESQIGRQL